MAAIPLPAWVEQDKLAPFPVAHGAGGGHHGAVEIEPGCHRPRTAASSETYEHGSMRRKRPAHSRKCLLLINGLSLCVTDLHDRQIAAPVMGPNQSLEVLAERLGRSADVEAYRKAGFLPHWLGVGASIHGAAVTYPASFHAARGRTQHDRVVAKGGVDVTQ